MNGEKTYDRSALQSAKDKIKDDGGKMFGPPLTDNATLDNMRKVNEHAGMTGSKAYDNASSGSGVNYKLSHPRGMDGALDDLARHAGAGRQVPLRVTDAEGGGGHALLVSDFDPQKGYLVSDPMSGKTAWLSRDDMKNGTFSDAFSIDQAKLASIYVDPNK